MDLLGLLTPQTISYVLVSGTIVTLLSIVLYGTYNVYLHPLRKFPGPTLLAAYRLPFVYFNIKGVLPFRVKEFHAHYDQSSGLLQMSFLSLRLTHGKNQKDPFALPLVDPGIEPDIIIADDKNHARFRRLYGPAFTTKALGEQEEMLSKYANLLIVELGSNVTKNGVQDITAWYNFVTFNLTGEFAFSESFYSLESGQYHSFVKTIFDGVRLVLAMNQIERYGLWTVLRQFLPKSAYKVRHDMLKYVKDLVDRRMTRGFEEGSTDVFNYILRERGDQEITRGELYNNAQTLVIAGSETTATLLSGVTWYLLKDPEKLAKVKHEVRSTFENDSENNSQTVLNLPYMLAVLREGLRIFPPSPWGFPRRIKTKGGQVIVGYWVPENTLCAVFNLVASHSPENWVRPEEFIPERWLEDVSDEFATDERESSQPFSFGPRNCLGKNLAYAEMRLIIAKMLWNLDFELADPTDNWMSRNRAYKLWFKGPLWIKLKQATPKS